MTHIRVLFFAFFTISLLSCQPSSEMGVPGSIIDWRPTPLASRTPLPEPTAKPSQEEPVSDEVAAEPEQKGFRILDLSQAAPTHIPIPTLAPTPLPDGVYRRESDGFEVVYPTSWEVVDSGSFGVALFDPGFGLNVSLFSEILAEESSFEGMLDYFQHEEDFLDDAKLVSEEEFPLADEGIIRVATLTYTDDEGGERAVRLSVMEDGNRAKQMVVYGELEDFEARKATLNAIMGQAKPGGTQVFGLDRDDTIVLLGGDPLPLQLDPARTTMGAGAYAGLLYRGLVHLSPELQIVPDLAKSWVVNDDGTLYTFTLREDVKFQSGRPITASDVKNSWERALDPDTGSTTAATYLGDIAGAIEKLNGEAANISGLTIIDEKTVAVTLDGPKPYFLAKLTYPTSFVIDLESVDEEDETWVYEPNASGPYTLRDFREEEALIFARNENYHEPGSIANVVYLLYRIGTGISLFESGEVDLVYLNPIESQEVRKPANPLHQQWQTTTTMCTIFVQMNNTRPPLDDANVRRALALAVDRQGLNDLFFEGMEVVGHTILPPAMPGYSLSLEESLQGSGYDPQEARAALSASAYADNLPQITIVTEGYGDTESDYINALVNGWQEVLGADISVEYLDPENFSKAAREAEGQLVSYGWCADYPDPQNFLEVLYHGQSEFNVADYKNEEIDALLEAAAVELDVTRRLELYQEIEAKLLADYATIPLRHNVSDVLVNPRIKGFVLSPVGISPINALSIEPQDGE